MSKADVSKAEGNCACCAITIRAKKVPSFNLTCHCKDCASPPRCFGRRKTCLTASSVELNRQVFSLDETNTRTPPATKLPRQLELPVRVDSVRVADVPCAVNRAMLPKLWRGAVTPFPPQAARLHAPERGAETPYQERGAETPCQPQVEQTQQQQVQRASTLSGIKKREWQCKL